MSGMPFFIATLKKFWSKGGVKVNHATLNRWIVRYSSSLAIAAKNRKRTVATSWHMNETYIKSKANEFTCIEL